MTAEDGFRQWLDVAVEEAETSWREGGIPIGAVLVDGQGAIVARGHNEREQQGDPTAHAEVACARNAGRRRDSRPPDRIVPQSDSPATFAATIR